MILRHVKPAPRLAGRIEAKKRHCTMDIFDAFRFDDADTRWCAALRTLSTNTRAAASSFSHHDQIPASLSTGRRLASIDIFD